MFGNRINFQYDITLLTNKSRCYVKAMIQKKYYASDHSKIILKESIYKELIDSHLLTLQSLALNSPDARRNIDHVYYVAAQLNESIDLDKIQNKEFIKYLFYSLTGGDSLCPVEHILHYKAS